MAAPVLITGATGFVGSHVARRLAAEGRELHALARASSDRGALAGLEVRWHAADLGDPASLERALGTLAGRRPDVVHCAATISYRTADAELQWEVNVEGTRRLLSACVRHGAGRVVHVSSVVAVGYSRDGVEVLDEDSPFNGYTLGCDYVRTKRIAEEAALQLAESLDLCVVNPGAIFGPDSLDSNTTAFLVQVQRGILGPFAPPGGLSVVGVEDVAEGIALALERGRRGRRYLLCESNLSLFELIGRVATAVGARPPRWKIPGFLWRSLVGGLGLADRLRPAQRLTPQALGLLGIHFRFDADRAQRELGWRPQPFERVLARTAEFARGKGLLR